MVEQCRALTAVACVAKTAEAKFGKYYDAFIPGIKAIVMAAAPKAGTDPQVCVLTKEHGDCRSEVAPESRELRRSWPCNVVSARIP